MEKTAEVVGPPERGLAPVQAPSLLAFEAVQEVALADVQVMLPVAPRAIFTGPPEPLICKSTVGALPALIIKLDAEFLERVPEVPVVVKVCVPGVEAPVLVIFKTVLADPPAGTAKADET